MQVSFVALFGQRIYISACLSSQITKVIMFIDDPDELIYYQPHPLLLEAGGIFIICLHEPVDHGVEEHTPH